MMTFPQKLRRRARATAATPFLLLALVATGLAGTSAPARAADPLLGAPEVGRCFQVSQAVADGASTTAPTVDCAKPHRLEVYAVLEVPARIDLTTDNQAFYSFAATRCDPIAADLLGDGGVGYARSAYDVRWLFRPTPEQQAEGAHWVACLLGVSGGLQRRSADGAPTPGLSVVKGAARPVTGRLPRSLQRCIERLGGAVAFTQCSRRHSHEIAGAPVVLKAPERARSARAEAYCDRALRREPDRVWTWVPKLDDRRRFVVACYAPR